MIAFDLLEEMNPGSLQLVSADAGSYGRARLIEVSVEKGFRKRAHGKPRHRHVAERDRPIPAYRHTRMQFMGFAAQREKLGTCRGPIGRLGEAPLAKRQGLVAPDHNAVSGHRRDRTRLLPCQSERDLSRTPCDALLDGALVEMRRTRLDRNARGLKQRPAYLALRGEHERLRGKPQRH